MRHRAARCLMRFPTGSQGPGTHLPRCEVRHGGGPRVEEPMTRSSKRALALLALPLLVAAGACGGSDSSGESADTTAASTPPAPPTTAAPAPTTAAPAPTTTAEAT